MHDREGKVMSRPIRIRQASAGDTDFLWEMLTLAASMSPAGKNAVPTAKCDAFLSTYVAGWPKAGDLGVIALDDDKAVGATWVRLGLDLSAAGVPELATAVYPEYQRRGIGSLMMTELIRMCSGTYSAIILSVRASNPALHFYERFEFTPRGRLENRVGTESIVMSRRLQEPVPR